eukprot:TRINITY_DN16972_c0_g1_i3.p2 TRINITY_DN16972_c0_g1~~TRINITY_DN16972_c0_g1_i3.p2  ORF type:complete len:141 (-),score=41.35 TRINITY_DN16972_c0_g1_i3:102-473(-)
MKEALADVYRRMASHYRENRYGLNSRERDRLKSEEDDDDNIHATANKPTFDPPSMVTTANMFQNQPRVHPEEDDEDDLVQHSLPSPPILSPSASINLSKRYNPNRTQQGNMADYTWMDEEWMV